MFLVAHFGSFLTFSVFWECCIVLRDIKTMHFPAMGCRFSTESIFYFKKHMRGCQKGRQTEDYLHFMVQGIEMKRTKGSQDAPAAEEQVYVEERS